MKTKQDRNKRRKYSLINISQIIKSITILENPFITQKSETEEIRNVSNGYRGIDWKPKQGSILEFHYSYQESVELVTFLGSGSYGEVWKGKEKSSGREVAVKLETPTLGVSFLMIFS